MKHAELSVIIVNYNVKYFLENCLLSVKYASQKLDVEVIVCDNHSTDNSREYLENKFPGVKFQWLPVNTGFSKANNEGLKQATGKYILFLNPDTIVAEDTLLKCTSFLNANPQCGALGVRMVDGCGKYLPESKRGIPSPVNSLVRLTGADDLFPHNKKLSGYYAAHIHETETAPVDILAGAFLMTRKSVLESVGSFDETFFMFGEDVDLSYRIQKSGLENIYFGETTIVHFKGESSRKKSRDHNRHFYGAMKIFVNKHYNRNRLLMYAAIGTGSFFSGLKHALTSSKPDTFLSRKTAVVAGQERFEQMIRILKFAPAPLMITGRISTSSADNRHCIGSVNNLETLVSNGTVEQVLFCQGELSNTRIIELIQKLSGKADFLFHQSGSHSIIGSNNRNSNGIFISAG